MTVTNWANRTRRVTMVLICLTLATAGCGGNSGGSDGGETITLRFGHVFAEGSLQHEAIMRAVEQIEDETDGRVEIQVFPAGQLGSDSEMDEALQEGSLDMRAGTLPESKMPSLAIQAAPFLFDDPIVMQETMRGDVANDLVWDPMKEELGVRLVDAWYTGTFTIFCNAEVTDPDSASGVKMRIAQTQNQVDQFEAMGFTAVPIPFPEAYLAFQTGVADCAYLSFPVLYEAKFDDVLQNLVDIPVGIPLNALTISDRTWSKLSTDDQQVLQSAFRDAGDQLTEETIAKEAEYRTEFEGSDSREIIEPDIEAFREAVEKDFLPDYDSVYGAGTYDALRDEAEKVKAAQ
ncbi:TRAP transporter substrate-binding protein [Aeromicrobium sp. Leaf350]|uniref:TRAP transporter substrate-binding protein n=1 Tax=Aeromicrobium sp. Leaf350 TaxID=2876565 RepID=UPI001E3E72AE|nr:TRAP transporter substrate-binding protein [Aeromicrobium sp. Leaf350]